MPELKPDEEKTEEDFWKEMEEAEAAEVGAKPAANGHDPDAFAENPEDGKDTPPEEKPAAPSAGAAAKPPEDDKTAPDPWATAPPELKAAHDAQVKALETAQTEHARRSIEGRIASYTRRLKERNAAAAQQPPPAADGEAADPLAELAAEYPEIATPLQKKLAPIAEKLSRFDAVEKSRQEAADREMDSELKANETLLESKHPGWDGYLRENGAAFGKWIVDQPLKLRQAFLTNQEAIIDPQGAIETMDAFKQFVDAAKAPPAQEVTPPVKAPNQGLNSRRAAQLASSASPQGGGSRPTVSGIPEDGDPQQLWNAFRDIDPEEQKYRNA